jgi:hypothetical protein
MNLLTTLREAFRDALCIAVLWIVFTVTGWLGLHPPEFGDGDGDGDEDRRP